MLPRAAVINRGVNMRLVATFPRWAVGTLALAAGFVAAVQAYVTFTHSGQTLGAFSGLIAGFVVVDAVLVYAGLSSEEARLARELRTARTGTTALRGLVIGRRQQAPFLTRLFSTRLGAAAVMLAEADRQGALAAMAGGSALMRGGRLDLLREVIDADAERATGTSVGLERCVGRLRELPPTGNREADLYRAHVLVKALLEQGDADGALELYGTLEKPTRTSWCTRRGSGSGSSSRPLRRKASRGLHCPRASYGWPRCSRARTAPRSSSSGSRRASPPLRRPPCNSKRASS